MDLHLAGHGAVVVGGASGIGLAIARQFAREGARVALADVSEGVARVAEELPGTAGAHGGWRVDATDYGAMTDFAQHLFGAWSGVHHVVVAAGCGSGKYGFPFWNLQPSDWERVWRVNMMSAVHAAHAFAPALTSARRGTLLFISSIAGQIGSQTDPPYSAAKAAMINFAQCVAKDVAAYNVRANTICPGMVQTPLNRSVWQAWHDQQPVDQRQTYEQWAGEKVKRVAPLGRWQTPEDIATLAVFLASERAANITGQTLNVDGGQVMHW